MNIEMWCPVCQSGFDFKGNVDSCSDHLTVILDDKCPTCGFHVWGDFQIDEKYSEETMKQYNQDKGFEIRYVESTTIGEVWAAKGAPALKGQVCDWCAHSPRITGGLTKVELNGEEGWGCAKCVKGANGNG